MKVQVSKPMAREIEKAMKARGYQVKVEVAKFSERGYILQVAGSEGAYEARGNSDYDWMRDEYKAIKVLYPEEFYAMPAYITTYRLNKLFKEGDTLDELMDAVCHEIEI